MVETGTQRYPCEITDISNRGAKVMTREQLETGSVVRLQIVAPDGAPLRVGAVVRRIDADGVAFSFARSIYHRFIPLAQFSGISSAQGRACSPDSPSGGLRRQAGRRWARDRVGLSTLGLMRLRRRVQRWVTPEQADEDLQRAALLAFENQPLPSDLPSELIRWFENMQRLLDRLAQTAEQQKQLHERVERLVRENEELREEINHLRNMVTHLTGQRAETAQALRGLAAYVTAFKDHVLRQSREGRSSE